MSLIAIDIKTGEVLQPEHFPEDGEYCKDEQGNRFSYVAPVDPIVSKVTKITIGSFRRRLTTNEKIAMEESPVTLVKVLKDDLLFSSYVDLESEELVIGLQALEDLGILGDGRSDELLVEGTPEEAY